MYNVVKAPNPKPLVSTEIESLAGCKGIIPAKVTIEDKFFAHLSCAHGYLVSHSRATVRNLPSEIAAA